MRLPQWRPARGTLWQLTAYFLTLGTIGFGGPVALVGYMQRDLVERRRWIDDEEYKLGLALAQIMPGPLAAQLAIAIGYFAHGVLGATLVGLAFVLPSFLMVLGAVGALRGVWRAVVDAGRLLRRLRRGHRHHRHRRLQAGPQGQRARSAPVGHLRRTLCRRPRSRRPSWRSSSSWPAFWCCW